MRRLLSLTAFGSILLATQCYAGDGIVWEKDLDAAKSAAKRSNRLVLVHFGATWCKACQQVERDVFGAPDFGKELKKDYVAVKLNYDNFPATAHQYGVGPIPCDVILAPNGQVIERMSSPLTSTEYVAALERVAVFARTGQRPMPQQVAMAGGTTVMTTAGPATQAMTPNASGVPGPLAAGTSTPTNNPYMEYYNQQRAAQPAAPGAGAQPHLTAAAQKPAGQTDWLAAQPPGAQPAVAQPAQKSEVPARGAPQIPPGNPPLALNGYCPVTLVEQGSWAYGDARYGMQHRGRTYLFGGPHELERFRADPDRFSPVCSGNDPVLELDQRQTVPGSVYYGLFCRGHIYLFSSELTLQRFRENQNRYVIEAQQARTANAPAAAMYHK